MAKTKTKDNDAFLEYLRTVLGPAIQQLLAQQQQQFDLASQGQAGQQTIAQEFLRRGDRGFVGQRDNLTGGILSEDPVTRVRQRNEAWREMFRPTNFEGAPEGVNPGQVVQSPDGRGWGAWMPTQDGARFVPQPRPGTSFEKGQVLPSNIRLNVGGNLFETDTQTGQMSIPTGQGHRNHFRGRDEAGFIKPTGISPTAPAPAAPTPLPPVITRPPTPRFRVPVQPQSRLALPTF